MVNTTELRVYMTLRDNMTVKELARKIGKSPATLSRWLDNKDMPVSSAEAIANVLHIPEAKMTKIFFATV